MNVVEIHSNTAMQFLLPRHYSGRKPQITKAFGLLVGGSIRAVCTFGKPVSHFLCTGVCGEKWATNVFELNRLCVEEGSDIILSSFVSSCLKGLKPLNWIIVSYADTAMDHHGYIYQATNFIYTGKTKERTDKYTRGNKHSRHYEKGAENTLRKIRSAKHRYVFFCANSKKIKKEMLNDLIYPILPYPKGQNRVYKLGQFLEPNILFYDKSKIKENLKQNSFF